MLLSNAIDGFLDDARGGTYSPKYVPTLESQFKRVSKFFGNRELESITLADWKKYLAYLRFEYKPRRKNGDQSNLSEATIDNHRKMIRSFCRWGEEILSIPRVDLKLPRPRFRSPQAVPFSETEVRRLIGACQYANVEKKSGQKYKFKRPNAIRNKAVLMILLDTGMRAGELSRLRLEDVNLESGEIYINPYRDGRKSRERTVFIGSKTKKALTKYIFKTRSQSGNSLFSLAPVAIRYLIRRLGENAKVPNAHPHRFRHTFAIAYLRNRGNVFTLQRLLGHSTLDMSLKYLDIALSDVAAGHKYASPVDCWKL